MTEQVAQIGDALDLQILERLPGGHFGAFLVRTAAGAHAVLKVLPDWPELSLDRVGRAAELVGRLTDDGYPAPRYLAVGVVEGTVYTVQEFVAGEVPTGLTAGTAQELVGYWRTQVGAADAVGSDWGTSVIERARGAAELRSATTDPQVWSVLDRAMEVAATADPGVFRADDVVHGDFSPGNLLVRDGTIAAVIDWEEARAGDARADLLRLYAVAATWQPADSPVVVFLRNELDATTPAEVRLPIGAAIVALHLRYGLFARPDEMDWVLREAEILLSA